MNCAKPFAVALSALALTSCGNVGGPLGPSAEERTRDALNACIQDPSDQMAMVEAAGNRAISPAYAAEARTAAEACRQSRTTLREIDQNHPCLPVVQFFEDMNWALASAFEGKQDFDTFAMTANLGPGDPTACPRASGTTPEQIAEIQQADEAMAAEKKRADEALQEAEDAAVAAMSAAAGQ